MATGLKTQSPERGEGIKFKEGIYYGRNEINQTLLLPFSYSGRSRK